MPWGDKTKAGLENWFTAKPAPDKPSWSDKIGVWLVSSVSKSIYKSFADMEPGAIDGIRAQLLKLRDDPNLPPEVKTVIDKALTPGNPLLVIVGAVILLLTMTGMLNALLAPVNRALEYKVDRGVESFRMDPGTIISLWLRDPAKYAFLLDDLDEQGWSEPKIEGIKFLSQIIPGVQDLIRMSVREAFSPEIAEKFGQYQDPPVAVYPWAEKLGLSKEWVDRYWAAHWELPSAGQGIEMLHRGIIDDATLELLLRALDVMPYWRDKVIATSWNIPTRVDVRRFWEMRTIDEARLREIYTSIGYHGRDLDDYVLWTKIYTDFPDLLARYKNGWITLDQVKSELVAMGMDAARADTMIEEKVKKAAPERTATEKDLTKSDIYKGVKQGRITRDEGLELLVDIGYDPDEAAYLMDINVPLDAVDQVVEERQLTKADILSGLKTGVVTRDEARQKLLDIRYSVANAELLLKIYDAQVNVPIEPASKEASKADIITGVKKGIITQEEGYLMLVELGFAADAALFILSVMTEESPFSPINYSEFKDLTQKYRKAAGLEGPPMNEDIKKAATEVVRLTTDRDTLQRSIDQERRGLMSEGTIPEEATARLTKLQMSLYQVNVELVRANSEYQRLVTEFRHTL